MDFIYVHTEASDNVDGDPVAITVGGQDLLDCLSGNTGTIRRLVEAEGLHWPDVTRVIADGEDLRLCYTRGGW
jgi:hypothetical protein